MRTAGWIPLEVQVRGPGWQRAGQPLPGFLPISPLASCPSRIPGASTSQRPKTESREQRNPSSPSFPLALYFLPSHLPSSLALLFLFFSLPLSSQETSPPPQSPAPKGFPFYGLELNILEVMGKTKI